MPLNKRVLTVLCDTSEKKMVRFPPAVQYYWRGATHTWAVTVEERRLPTADYTLDGWEGFVLIERKGSAEELWTNLLTADWVRFEAVLKRMAMTTRHPTLALIMPASGLVRNYHGADGLRVYDRLTYECRRFGLSLLWLPPSQNVTRIGELLVRYMLSCILTDQYGEPLCPTN